jgi:hypothetical protein
MGHQQQRETPWSVRQEHAESVNRQSAHSLVKPNGRSSTPRVAKTAVEYLDFSVRFDGRPPWKRF